MAADADKSQALGPPSTGRERVGSKKIVKYTSPAGFVAVKAAETIAAKKNAPTARRGSLRMPRLRTSASVPIWLGKPPHLAPFSIGRSSYLATLRASPYLAVSRIQTAQATAEYAMVLAVITIAVLASLALVDKAMVKDLKHVTKVIKAL